MGVKKSLSTALAALFLAAALSGCACAAGEGAQNSPAAPSPGLASFSAIPSRSDHDTGFSSSDTHILLNGDSATVTGPGARIDGAVVTIEAGKSYGLYDGATLLARVTAGTAGEFFGGEGEKK